MTLEVFELSGSQVSWSKCRHSTSTTIKALVKNLSKLPLDKLNISKNGYFAFLYKISPQGEKWRTDLSTSVWPDFKVFLYFWPNFHCCKRVKYGKYNLAIWSHCSTFHVLYRQRCLYYYMIMITSRHFSASSAHTACASFPARFFRPEITTISIRLVPDVPNAENLLVTAKRCFCRWKSQAI